MVANVDVVDKVADGRDDKEADVEADVEADTAAMEDEAVVGAAEAEGVAIADVVIGNAADDDAWREDREE